MKVSLRLFFCFCFLSGFIFTISAQKKLPAYIAYIDQYYKVAVAHEQLYKIPASITLAQALLESAAGTSDLAKNAKNHFGIKCGSDWTGDKVYKRDDGPNDCFRKYKSVQDSYEDHAKFLQKSRYAVLFTYNIKDYTTWAKGLQTCGYATFKGYANQLIQLIELYELYKYSAKSTPAVSIPPISEKSSRQMTLLRETFRAANLIYVIVKEDDSLDQIANDTGIKLKDLVKFNEVPADFPLKKGDIIYLQKKKSKADKPYFEHVVKVGESMHSISQRYGIKVSNLYKMNKLKTDHVPTEGDVLRLR